MVIPDVKGNVLRFPFVNRRTVLWDTATLNVLVFMTYWLLRHNIDAYSCYRNDNHFTITKTRIGDSLKYASFTTYLDNALL